jgi:hypothetical protein
LIADAIEKSIGSPRFQVDVGGKINPPAGVRDELGSFRRAASRALPSDTVTISGIISARPMISIASR